MGQKISQGLGYISCLSSFYFLFISTYRLRFLATLLAYIFNLLLSKCVLRLFHASQWCAVIV